MVVNSFESVVPGHQGTNKKKNYAAASRSIFIPGHCGHSAGVYDASVGPVRGIGIGDRVRWVGAW